MTMARRTLALFVAVVLSQFAITSGRAEPPVLRLESDSPTQIIWSLAFSADGKTLYSVGSDKMVHAWTIQDGHFTRDPARTLRVPLGAGLSGVVNSLAVSNDGEWMAVGGIGWSTEFFGHGFVPPVEALSDELRRELYALRIFNLKTGEQFLLRGHTGPPRAITFIDGNVAGREGGVELFSIADHPGDDEQQEVRHWSIKQKRSIGPPLFLAHSIRPPILRGWRDSQGDPHAAIVISVELDPELKTNTHIWHPAESNRVEIAKLPPLLVFDLIQSKTGSPQAVVGGNGGIAISNFDSQGRMSNLVPVPNYLGQGWNGWGVPLVASAFKDRSGVNRVALLTGAKPAAEYDIGLVLYDTVQKRFGARKKMWAMPDLRPPHISIAPLGRYAALAGMPNNGIRILDGNNIASGEMRIQQTIQSERLHPESATFVTNESTGVKGIAIGTQVQPASEMRSGATLPKTSFILNLNDGRISAGPPGWKIAIADRGGWRSSFTGAAVTVTPPGKTSHQIPLPHMLDDPARRVSASLVVPSPGEGVPPLLFVASNLYRNAEIGIYDANDGTLLQMMTNHLGKVTHLALDASRQVLLSTAEDGSVSGWWIENLGSRTLGQVGAIHGLIVKDRGAQVVVSRIQPTSVAATVGLQAEDIITGVVYDKKFLPLRNANDLYIRVARQRPDSRITLRVAKATGTRDIAVPVTQGADEKVPLFTITLDGPRNRLKWTAWTPTGYYDGNHDPASRLGWHTNTGVDENPVQYVSAAKHNPQAHRNGLLQSLLTNGPLASTNVLELNLDSVALIDADDKSLMVEANNIVRMKTGPTAIQVKLSAAAQRRIRFVELQDPTTENAKPIRLHETTAGTWSVAFDAIDPDLKPQLQIAVMTTDVPSRKFTREITIVPFARPPVITLANRGFGLDKPFRTQSTTLQIKADVTCEQQLQRVELLLDDKPQPVTFKPGQSFKLNQVVELTPGKHSIEIRATSDGKTSKSAWSVVCEPPPVALVVESISSAGTPIDAVVSSDGISFSKPAARSTATIHGRITVVGDQEMPNRVRLQLWQVGFMKSTVVEIPSGANDVAFQIPVTLTRTKNQFRIEAPELSLTSDQLKPQAAVQIDCEKPAGPKPIYAVVVGAQMKGGANVSDADSLMSILHETLQMADPNIEPTDLHVLGPLVGEQATGRRMGLLIRSAVNTAANTNGHVVVYFAGNLHTDGEETLLMDSENFLNPPAYSASLNMSRVQQLVSSHAGLHAIILDGLGGQPLKDGELPSPDQRFRDSGVYHIDSSKRGAR